VCAAWLEHDAGPGHEVLHPVAPPSTGSVAAVT
jgi:hypothetical protein